MREIPDEVSGEHTYRAFKDKFPDRNMFNQFVETLSIQESRNKFLRLGSLYYCLVKSGDWVVDVPDSDPVIDYFTDSYKLVTLFSLIESLSTDRFIDFYTWLISKKRKHIFPVERVDLERHYAEYKADYGAIKKVKTFFDSLPAEQSRILIDSFQWRKEGVVEDNNKEEIASYLYYLRSSFVHEGNLVLTLGSGAIVGKDKDSIVLVRLDLRGLMDVFEVGVLNYFTTENES